MIFDNIPEELRKLPQWVLWRLEDGKKIPYQPTGGRASTTNKEHYSSYNDVISRHFMGGYSGIGFVFTANDDYVGIDMDNAVVDGQYAADAIKVLNQFAGKAYAELSQSGKGIHIICKGKLFNRKSDIIEMYNDKRYFALTGKRINGLETITNCQKEIEDVHSWYFDKSTVDTPDLIFGERPEDFDLVCDMYQSKSGEKIKRLWQGDISEYNNDHSAADQALCNFLAFWLKKDKEEMDRFFRMSGLCRPKWDEIHNGKDTYGQMTIQKAIDGCRDVYTGKKPRKYNINHTFSPKKLKVVEQEPMEWIWRPYVPRGELTLVSGDGGVGKSFFMAYLMAEFSKGRNPDIDMSIFCGQGWQPLKVLYISAEDSIEKTTKSRLVGLGANEDNIDVFFYRGGWGFDDEIFQSTVKANKYDVIIFDPLKSLLTGDYNKANEIRQELSPLLDLAHETKAAIIGIHHNNKNEFQSAAAKVSGSSEFVNIPRNVITVVKVDNTQKAFGQIKTNMPGASDIANLWHIDENGRFVYDGISGKTIYELASPRKEGRQRQTPALDEAVVFLRNTLADGPKMRDEIMREAYNLGISEMSLKRAKVVIGVQSERMATVPPRSIWSLPEYPQGDST